MSNLGAVIEMPNGNVGNGMDDSDVDDAEIQAMGRVDELSSKSNGAIDEEEMSAVPDVDRETCNEQLENALNSVDLDEREDDDLEEGIANELAVEQSLKKAISFKPEDISADLAEINEADAAAAKRKSTGNGARPGDKKRASLVSYLPGRRSLATKENLSNLQFFARNKFDDESIGRIRATMYVRQGDDAPFHKVGTSESNEFCVYRTQLSAVTPNLIRILYSAQRDDGSWEPFGYISESVQKILLSDKLFLGKAIRSVRNAAHVGSVQLVCEETNALPYNVKLSFGIQGNRVPHGQSQFLVLKRLVQGMGMITVYTTPLPRSQNRWDAFRIPLRRLCNGNVDMEITVSVLQRSAMSDRDDPGKIVGTWSSTVAKCERLHNALVPLQHSGEETGAKLQVFECSLERFATKAATQEAKRGGKGGPKASKFSHKLNIDNKFALRTTQKEIARNRQPDLVRAGSTAPTGKVSNERFRRIVTRQATIRKRYAEQGRLGMTAYYLREWWATQPLQRLASRLPIERKVVRIGIMFGSSTAAFFSFLRWLMFVNFVFVTIWCCLVIVPHCVSNNDVVGDDIVDILKALFGVRSTDDQSEAKWSLYGDYLTKHDGGYYYTWATLATIAATIILVTLEVRRTASNVEFSEYIMRRHKMMGRKYPFCAEVFAGWDFHIGSQNASEAKAAGIIHTLKLKLADSQLTLKRNNFQSAASSTKLAVFCQRLFFIVLSMGIGAGCIFGIVYITNHPEEFYDDSAGETNKFIPSMLVTAINVCSFPLVKACVKREYWNDNEFESSQIISRAFLIKISNLMALYYSLRFKASNEALSEYDCVQNLIGNSLLRLFVAEWVVDIANTLGWPLVYTRLLGRPHKFNVVTNVLGTVYRQMIVWFGFFYSPSLVLLAPVLTFFTFFMKGAMLLHVSSPEEKPWSANKAQLFFMKVTTAAMFFSMAPVVHFLMSNFTKEDDYATKFACGPHSTERVVDYLWKDSTPAAIREIFTFLMSPIFLVVLVVALSLMLIYHRQLIKSAVSDLRTLNQELEDEHHDKLKLLSNVGILDNNIL